MAEKKVLIVEDDKMLSTVYRMFLKDLGHELIGIFPDGYSAIEKCKEVIPDVVMMDIFLQGDIDGINTAKILQENYDIPVIYVSGITDEQTIQRAIGTKSYGFLVKPVDKTELGIAIELAYVKHKFDNELKIREYRYRSLVQDLPDALMLITNGKIEYVNYSGLKLFGTIHIENMLGNEFISLVDNTCKESISSAFADALNKSGKIDVLKVKFNTLNNKSFQAEMNGSVIDYKNQQTIQLIINDISDLEKSKVTVLEQDNIIENIYDGIFTLSLAGKIKHINKGTERIFGINKETSIGKSFSDFFPEIDESYIHEHLLIPSLEKDHVDIEMNITNPKSKEKIYLQLTLSTLKNITSETVGIVCYCKDITKKKQIEKRLKESEEKFRLLSLTNNDAYWDWDIKTNSIYFSPRFKSLLGYEDKEFSNAMGELDRRLEPNDRITVNKLLNEHLEGKVPIYSAEYRLMHKDGNYRWFLDRGLAIRDDEGIPYRMIGTMAEITDQKNSNHLIRVSEANLKAIFNSNKEAIFLVDKDLQIIDLNKKAKIYSKTFFNKELKSGDSIFSTTEFLNQAEAKELFQNTLSASITHNLERSIYINGVERYLEITIYPIHDDNNEDVNRFCLSFFDVTDRKKIERDLKETRSELKPMFDSSIQRFYLCDFDFKLVAFNKTAYEAVKEDTDLILKKGDNVLQFVPNEVGKELFIQRFKAARNGEHISYKDLIVTPAGKKWVETHIEPISNEKGEIIRILIWTLDITKEKKAEEALIDSQKKYYSLFSEANDGIMLINDDSDLLIDFNDKVVELFGYTKEELSKVKLIDLAADVQRDGSLSSESRFHILNEIKRGEKKYTFSWCYKKKNGELFDAEVSMSIVNLGEYNFRYALIRDITDRLKIEKELRESEQRNKSLVQAIPDLIFIIDKEGVYRDYMADNEKIYLVPAEKIVGKSLMQYFKDEKLAEYKNCIIKAIETSKLQKIEYQLNSMIGLRWFEARITRLNDNEVLCLVRDIQDQKISQN